MMRMNSVMILGLAVMMVAGVVYAAAPDLSVLPSEVRGVVLMPDGSTPVDKLRVRVWDADREEIVFKTRTDASGVFNVPRLEQGNHYVTVGPVRIDMRILTARAGAAPQPHGVVVVVPKRLPLIPALIPGAAAAAAVPKVMSP